MSVHVEVLIWVIYLLIAIMFMIWTFKINSYYRGDRTRYEVFCFVFLLSHFCLFLVNSVAIRYFSLNSKSDSVQIQYPEDCDLPGKWNDIYQQIKTLNKSSSVLALEIFAKQHATFEKKLPIQGYQKFAELLKEDPESIKKFVCVFP